ncbi:hypothetical protein BDF21DRAFT_125140 [Thamnidium elegans]|nr:hypothetical protein BDF21DRAFT_125140 [Thamnidium elegans]
MQSSIYRGFVFKTWLGNNQKILLHWGDTMSETCKSMSLRFKLDLKLLMWKEDVAIFDGGTGEMAKKATPFIHLYFYKCLCKNSSILYSLVTLSSSTKNRFRASLLYLRINTIK